MTQPAAPPSSSNTARANPWEYDVVVVGAGPGGLATAIHLKQLAAQKGQEISVCVLEKGSEPGAHILSGAVMDPRALTELLPKLEGRRRTAEPAGGPAMTCSSSARPARSARPTGWCRATCTTTAAMSFRSATSCAGWLRRPRRWASRSFPALLRLRCCTTRKALCAAWPPATRASKRTASPAGPSSSAWSCWASTPCSPKGARGHLGKQLIAQYRLDAGRDPQSYGIGIKELWEIEPARAKPGLVVHTAGWPIEDSTFGGGFLYHLEDNKVALGFVIGLDYANPWMSPFEEMQRWKTHPAIRAHIEGGKRIGYGARAINNGTPQALPKTVFPGGALIGCDAGYLNAARIKGSHAAIKSGMLCAQAAFDAVAAGRSADELTAYPQAFEASWLHEELDQSRNFKLWFKKGKLVGNVMTGIEQWLLPKLGVASPPWTLHATRPDHLALQPASTSPQITYPKPDGKLSFDRLSSVFISNTTTKRTSPRT